MIKTCECGNVLGEEQDDKLIVRKENHTELTVYGWTKVECPCGKVWLAKENGQ